MSNINAVKRRTPNLKLGLINFDFPSWADEEHKNLATIDAAITALGGIGIEGVWQNNQPYSVGQRVVDPDNSSVYLCEVEHTSASNGTFEADRTANPTYWTRVVNVPVNRGEWAASTIYNTNDIVNVGYVYYYCSEAHTSDDTSITPDLSKWEAIFDATAVVDDATTAKDAAESAESNAASSASAASTSASNASTSETNANDSATAASNSATAASNSADDANDSALAAASSESDANNSANAAATSASNALTSENNASTSASNALTSENKAQKWADEDEDVPVETGKFSARHWSLKADALITGFSLGDYTLTELSDVDLATVEPVNGDGFVFDGTKWVPGPAGGGMFKGNSGTVGARKGDIFRVNAQTLDTNTTIAADENASATGPLVIADGVTLTVADGGSLAVI